MGKTPSRNNPDYWCTEDNKWISIADLTKAGKYISDTKEFLSDAAVKESGIKIIPANTVIMSFKLSIGKTAITAEDMYSNEAIMAFHDKHAVDILPEYIFYLFKYRNWDESSNKAVMGKTLNKATLSEMEIDVCSIKKQREIVAVLDKMMRVLVNREKELFLLDNLIKARFVEMFGDPVKMIADGKIELVENLTDEVAVGFVGESTNEYVDNGIPYLRMQNIRPMKVISDNLIYINEEFHKRIRKAHVFTDDVVISRVGINRGMTAVIPSEYNNSSIGNAVIIRKSEKFNSVFLSAYITYVYGQHTSIGYSKGSAQGAISVGLVKKWPIIKANISLQNQFADFVNQVNKSKVKVQKALDETQKLFDSLMQQYFG